MNDPVVIVDETDRERWNAFVSDSPTGHFFQSWEWGELQEGLGGRPWRIAVTSEKGILGGAQLLVFDSETRRFSYVPRGPVVSPCEQRLAHTLVDAVLRISASEGAGLVRIEPQWTFDAASVRFFEQRAFTSARQHIMPARTLLVDLMPALGSIWAGFRSTTRNRIRAAEKRGVEIRVAGEDEVPIFVRLAGETNARHHLPPGRPEQFYQAAHLFGRRDSVRLFLARADGADVAGIFVFLWGRTATYLWGASSGSEEARRANPNQLLHWMAMQWARERGCTAYDFFGIPDYDVDVLEAEYPNKSAGWWNLYRFKRGFGGTVHRHLGTFDCRLEFS